ncbi:hypothetical protein [Nitrosomonas sp. Nm132]|uniref:hypothetical protein n=1 Tax=Nitrosomonas sp. Nm132 TaxID=1881053 RepID=UPI00088B7A30|nr:hypothetical protein [Nitrosomonas sp. Nm132]SDG96644.1 hypothetical protein SAMN05428952_100318 [Nitrosomonas sp. Nm132]
MIKHHPFLQKSLGKILLSASMIVTTGYAAICGAHGGGAVLDPAGNKATFTALARVTCFDESGVGPADYLAVKIRDNSPPVPGMFVSLQLLKGSKAINITDTTPGDAHFSPEVTLRGGNGTYFMMANKTMAGARNFEVEWHCKTVNNEHTGTDLFVDQFE